MSVARGWWGVPPVGGWGGWPGGAGRAAKQTGRPPKPAGAPPPPQPPPPPPPPPAQWTCGLTDDPRAHVLKATKSLDEQLPVAGLAEADAALARFDSPDPLLPPGQLLSPCSCGRSRWQESGISPRQRSPPRRPASRAAKVRYRQTCASCWCNGNCVGADGAEALWHTPARKRAGMPNGPATGCPGDHRRQFA
jgi:hypothetical protein